MMITICVIIAVIGSFIYVLLKVRIDEWLEDSSMKKQSRLSLRRTSQYSNIQGTSRDPVEISSDESFDPSTEKYTKECTNVISHAAVNVSNSVIDTSECNSKPDISDDLSSDEDIIIVDDIPNNVSNKSQSMFNWNKPVFVNNSLFNTNRNIFPESSGSKKFMSRETPNKRQKLMNYPANSSSSDEDFTSLNIHEKDDSPPKVEIQHDMMIGGVKIKFPLKPYPSQITVMNNLIKGCIKEQNCLLESPTGSGKTLALLCGALAWQEQFCEEIYRGGSDEEEETSYVDDFLSNNFFLNSSKYFDEEDSPQKKKPQKVPKIYYGTRTHKQIEQVIREFKKTAYRHKRMTILSSRKQTCIQVTDRNKNELCNELLDLRKGKSCPYYDEHIKSRAMFSNMKTPWDIEDLVSLGNDIAACPYFGAKSLMADADIIFCPYNYILDPDIRESMQINLKGDIVILDEAHNVEDTCREIASVNLRDDEISIAAMECENLVFKGCDHYTYSTLQEYLKDVVQFLKNVDVTDNADGFDKEIISKTWIGTEFRVLLDVNNVGCSRFPNFLAASRAAIYDFIKNTKEENPKKMLPTITQDTRKLLEHLCFAMQMITSDTFANDYRMYIIETNESVKKIAPDNVWTSSKVIVRTMKLICMNPAIIFAPLAHTTRSVIVTSGTLTPITSFQSELGTQFPCIANPAHIIPNNQVYVRGIPRGPNGISLKAVYDKVHSWNFQDELGNLILQVCDAVPYGVLCFFPSYKTMNNIYDRWKNNGILKKLNDLKTVFMEPQNNKDLPPIMTAYRQEIEKSSSKSFRTACGAILFAVYRGKVAEGIDFSDNEARCVLAVGIPYLYPSNDINMKKKYNDSKVSNGFLSGQEWYTINAFRAVNQAIGRCIRHKGDWGAVLLVDERYQPLQSNKFINYLPKWIKTNMKCNNSYDLEIELQDFVALQTARERGEKCIEN